MKSLYRDAKTNSQALFIFSSLAMIGFSIYLTSHYFEVKFPTGLGSAGLCNINSFFNCDVATNSPMSNIAGIPISLFGIITGALFLAGYIFKSDNVEGTNHFLAGLNFFGCIALFLYSLIGLGGLCPFCTLYYVASGIAFYVFYKNSSIKKPDIVVLVIYAIVAGLVASVAYSKVNSKMSKNEALAKSLINQFDSLPKLGKPALKGEYLLANVADGFDSAPIRITKFSDFQCPACKHLSGSLHKAMEKYKGKIAIQYFFYPLDPSCNPAIKRQLHGFACQAAYLGACLPNKFPKVEHDIFEHQRDLSNKWINDYAKKEGVEDCVKDPATRKKVMEYIEQAAPFNVKSTPTFLLNGVKIEGSLPLSQLYMLLDEIIRRSEVK